MTRRLVVANLVIILALLLLLEVPLALVYSRHEHDALNGTLQRDASAVGALVGEITEHPGLHDLSRLARRYSAGSRAVVVVVDPDGTELTATGLITSDPGFQAAIRAARSGTSGLGERGGLLYAAQPFGPPGPQRGAVLVARSDESVDHRVRSFWLLLAMIGACVIGVSLAVSGWLGHWVVEPLRGLERHAAHLGLGSLDSRAEQTGGPPEVVALVETFNQMTDRLDELVTSQRRFVADASHQLRTPLTALRLRLEAIDGARPDAVEVTRDAALAEADRLNRLVDGLLSLAQAEGDRPARQRIDVVGTVAERREAWEPFAAEHQIDLEFTADGPGPSTALLVPGHLEQILDNLIDNAIEASRAGGHVTLYVDQRAAEVRIHVTDEGRGMSEEERARAFDPFWRGSVGARRGTGLGLAIASQLARASRGTLGLEASLAGGVDAVVSFPVERPADAGKAQALGVP